MESSKNKNSIMLAIMGIFTIVIAVFGVTYAWFTLNIQNPKGSSLTVTIAQLGVVTYIDGNIINMNNVYSGSSSSKTFTITRSNATTDIDVEYKIQLVSTLNTLSEVASGAFDYELIGIPNGSGNAVNSSGDVPNGTGVFSLGIGLLKKSSSHTYTFNLYVREQNTDQNSIQGMAYRGYLDVVSIKNYSTGS